MFGAQHRTAVAILATHCPSAQEGSTQPCRVKIRNSFSMRLALATHIRRRLAALALIAIWWLFPLATGTILTTGEGMAQQSLVSGTGRVRFNPLEGGFLQIEADDRKIYTPDDPSDLPESLKGKRVRFVGQLQPAAVSIYMSGQILKLFEVTEIEEK